MKKLISKLGVLANCMALMLVIQSANTACAWIVHQPEFPEQASKFKKKVAFIDTDTRYFLKN